MKLRILHLLVLATLSTSGMNRQPTPNESSASDEFNDWQKPELNDLSFESFGIEAFEHFPHSPLLHKNASHGQCEASPTSSYVIVHPQSSLSSTPPPTFAPTPQESYNSNPIFMVNRIHHALRTQRTATPAPQTPHQYSSESSGESSSSGLHEPLLSREHIADENHNNKHKTRNCCGAFCLMLDVFLLDEDEENT